MKKPKADEIAKLGIGEFFACWGDQVHRTYVQPAWLDAEEARAIAQRKKVITPRQIAPSEQMASNGNQSAEVARLQATVEEIKREVRQIIASKPDGGRAAPALDFDQLYLRIIARLQSDSQSLMRLKEIRPALEVVIERPILNVDTEDLRGRISKLIADKFFSSMRNASQVSKELARHAWSHDPRTVGRELDKLAELGFFVKDKKASGEVVYSLVYGMSVYVKEL